MCNLSVKPAVPIKIRCLIVVCVLYQLVSPKVLYLEFPIGFKVKVDRNPVRKCKTKVKQTLNLLSVHSYNLLQVEREKHHEASKKKLKPYLHIISICFIGTCNIPCFRCLIRHDPELDHYRLQFVGSLPEGLPGCSECLPGSPTLRIQRFRIPT